MKKLLIGNEAVAWGLYPNKTQREERIAFYRRNGFEDTEVAYRWENEDYRIMSNGGDVSKREFWLFWDHFRPDRT